MCYQMFSAFFILHSDTECHLCACYLCYRKCSSLLPFWLRFSPSTNPTAPSCFKSLIWYLFFSCCREVYICQMPSYREQVKTVFSRNAVIFLSPELFFICELSSFYDLLLFLAWRIQREKNDSISDSAYSGDTH